MNGFLCVFKSFCTNFISVKLFLDECVYLVESIQKETKDDFGSADIENIFLIFKSPYLIEKSDNGKVN